MRSINVRGDFVHLQQKYNESLLKIVFVTGFNNYSTGTRGTCRDIDTTGPIFIPGGWGEGGLHETFVGGGGGVRQDSPNPGPVSDHNMQFFGLLLQTWPEEFLPILRPVGSKIPVTYRAR